MLKKREKSRASKYTCHTLNRMKDGVNTKKGEKKETKQKLMMMDGDVKACYDHIASRD